MRPNRKHNSILNSPFVRALINPVKTIIPDSNPPSTNPLPTQPIASSSKAPGVNPYLSIIAQERGEVLPDPEEHHLIPTQPQTESPSDLKGKKRAREEEEEQEEEWNEEAGTRFGEITRYEEGKNLPKELEKCTVLLSLLAS